MSEPWTPFCRRKEQFEHAIHCVNDVSCPYCGMANPNTPTHQGIISQPKTPPQSSGQRDTPIEISSSPPAHQSTSSTFPQLDQTSEIARQQSIRQSQTQRSTQLRPHAGSKILSSRPQITRGTKVQLAHPVIQKFGVTVIIYTGFLYDFELGFGDRWKSRASFGAYLTPADTYKTEEDLIPILARNYQQWDDLLKKYNPVKIMIAKSYEKGIRQPQIIPSDAIKLPVPQILTECFTANKIFLFLGCQEQLSDTEDTEAVPTKIKEEKKPKIKEEKMPKIKEEPSTPPKPKHQRKRNHSQVSPEPNQSPPLQSVRFRSTSKRKSEESESPEHVNDSAEVGDLPDPPIPGEPAEHEPKGSGESEEEEELQEFILDAPAGRTRRRLLEN